MKKVIVAAALALAMLASCASGGTDPDNGAGMTAENSGTAGGNTESASGAYRKLTADEGAALMNEGGVTVIDVRRADEYAEGHIPGALNIPNEEIGDAPPALLAELDAAIIVYCRSGNRSKTASEKLIAAGYTNVSDMGGILDWPYETVTGSEPGEYKAVELPEPDGILSVFSTVDINDIPVDQTILADYELTVVNVWATYCGPCLREMPDLGELAAEYKDKGVQILGLVSDTLTSLGTVDTKQVELARDIAERTGAAYTHLLPSEELNQILAQIYAVPTTFFVNSKGEQVGGIIVGSMSREDWVKSIEDKLEEVRA